MQCTAWLFHTSVSALCGAHGPQTSETSSLSSVTWRHCVACSIVCTELPCLADVVSAWLACHFQTVQPSAIQVGLAAGDQVCSNLQAYSSCFWLKCRLQSFCLVALQASVTCNSAFHTVQEERIRQLRQRSSIPYNASSPTHQVCHTIDST